MKKNKLLIALSLSVFLASCSAGFIACSKNNTDSDGGVDKSGAVDYESEYVWKYTPEFSDPCDENMTIDGVLDEDVWMSSDRKWLTFGGDGVQTQYSTYFTEKGLYVAAKVKDEKKLHWEARYNFSVDAGSDALNSAFNITIAGKIDDGAETFSKFIYGIDPKGAVSYQQSRFTAKATTDVDVDTGRATEMYAELFVTWESIYADINEETGMPDVMYIYPRYRQMKDLMNSGENTWITPLYAEDWRYQTYAKFDEDGYTTPEDPDAFWGNAGNGEPCSTGWDLSLNSSDSDNTVTSNEAHSQAIFAQNYYTDRYVFSVDMTIVNGIYIKNDADGVFRAGVCAETDGRNVAAMLFFGKEMENGLAHVARLDRTTGWNWKDPIAKKTYSDYDYEARNKTFNITVIKDLEKFYYIVEGELLCCYSEPTYAGKCSPGVFTLSSVAKYSNPTVKDYAGDEAGIKAEISKYAYRVILPDSVSGGTVTASSYAVDKADSNAKVQFTVTAQSGWVLSSVKVNGTEKIEEIQNNFVDGLFELPVTEDIELETKFSRFDGLGEVIKLEGTLYAADGTIIPDAEVKVHESGNPLFGYTLRTNQSGRFGVSFLKPRTESYKIGGITYTPSGAYVVSVAEANGLRKFEKTYTYDMANDKGVIKLDIRREKSFITDKVTNTVTNKTYTSAGTIDRSDEANGHIVIGKGTNFGKAWINMCENDAVIEFKVKNQLDCTVSENEASPAVGLYVGDGTDSRLNLLLVRNTVWVLPSAWSDERYEIGKTFDFDIRGTEKYIHLRYVKSDKAIVLQYNTGTTEKPVWEELFSASFESLEGKQLYGFTALSNKARNLSVDIKDIKVTTGNEAVAIAKEYLSRNVTLQVENEDLGKATLSGVTDGKANLGSTVTVNLVTENGAYVTVNGEKKFFTGNSIYTFTVGKDTEIVVSFVELTTYSVELVDKSLDASKLSATLNGVDIPIRKAGEKYTVAVDGEALLTFKYEGYHPVTISPSGSKYIVPAFTLRGADIQYLGTSPKVDYSDDGVTVSVPDKSASVQGYISGSEQAQGKSFIVETKITTSYMKSWNTYGFAVKYSNGDVLTLGISLRSNAGTNDSLKIARLIGAAWKGQTDIFKTTEAQAFMNSFKESEEVLLKLMYDASAKKYYVFGNGVLLGSFSDSYLGVNNSGEIVKFGFGARLDDGNKTMEFRSWKFVTEGESEYHTLACSLGIHETEVVEKKATCTENGEKTTVCKHCHEEIEKEIFAAHHTDENKDGVCDVCGNKLDISYGKKEEDGDTTGKDRSDW